MSRSIPEKGGRGVRLSYMLGMDSHGVCVDFQTEVFHKRGCFLNEFVDRQARRVQCWILIAEDSVPGTCAAADGVVHVTVDLAHEVVVDECGVMCRPVVWLHAWIQDVPLDFCRCGRRVGACLNRD